MLGMGERCCPDWPPPPGIRLPTPGMLPTPGRVLAMPGGSFAVPRVTLSDGEESDPRAVVIR